MDFASLEVHVVLYYFNFILKRFTARNDIVKNNNDGDDQ